MNTGLGPDVFVLDRHTAPDLDRQPVGVAVYVDNVGVVSQDSTLATITCTCIVAELEKHGLACKGVTAPSDEQGFTGLVFYRRSGRIAVSRSRAWRIRLAFLHAVSTGQLTGLELSKLVGALHLVRAPEATFALHPRFSLHLHGKGRGTPETSVEPS